MCGKIFAPPGAAELAVRAGHIPGAANVPWGRAVNEDGTFKSPAELKALYAAAGRGHAETASLLLAAGAQVDRTNTLGTTALFVACSNGYADAALVLLEARAQPDLPGGRNGSRPLLAATERGHMR